MPKKKISVTVESPSRKRTRTVPRSAFKPGNEFAFKPGHSGNPSGRAKDDLRLISTSLRAALPNRAPDNIAKSLGLAPGASWAMCVAAALLRAACSGDVMACREIRESTEGTRSRLTITDENGDALPVPSLVVNFVSGPHQELPHNLDGCLYDAPLAKL